VSARSVRCAAALLLLCLASAARAQQGAPHDAPQEAPPDVPAGEARISGRVLLGAESAPVPGVEVVLYALNAEGIPGLRRSTTDAQGRFAFEKLSGAADVAYLVGARYAGIPVPGGRVSFAAGQSEASADIRVSELTSDAGGVRIREQTLRLSREAAGLRVEETFTIENAGARIVYAREAERARAEPGLRATLPEGAADFRMPLGVIPEGLARAGSAVRYYGPFYPGAQDLVYAYRLAPASEDAGGARYALAFTPAQRVEKLVVLVPDGFSAFEAPGLAKRGTEQDAGRSVTRYELAAPRAPLALALSAPPARIYPSAVRVSEARLVLHADDAAISVTETYVLDVRGEGLLLGTEETPLLRVPLPPEASDVQFGAEAPGIEFAPQPGGGVAVLGNVSPGEVPVQLAYRVPVGEHARLERRFAARVPLLSVYIADTGRLAPRSERLHRAKPLRTDDLSYLVLEAFDVTPGERVAIELDALPPRPGLGVLASRVVSALGAVGIVAFLLVPLLGRASTEPLRLADEPIRNEREAIYDAIGDLDHDFETGKVSEHDHVQLREELRGRAVALLRAEQSGGGSSAPSAAAEAVRACSRCGAAAAAAHRFCAQCGAALEGAGSGAA
jgi:hypothetical protein